MNKFFAAFEKERVDAASLNILYCSSFIILVLLISNILYINFTYIKI